MQPRRTASRRPARSITGASSTSTSSATGAIAAISSAFWWPVNRSTEENITAPEDRQRDDVQQRLRHERAEHDRQVLPRTPGAPRDDQRARRLAEPGRQRRGHQHADERALHRVGQPDPRRGAARRAGSRARRTPRSTIARHIIAERRAARTTGSSCSSAVAMLPIPIFCSAEHAQHHAAERHRGERRRGAHATATRAGAAPAVCGSRLGSRRARRVRLEVGRTRADPHGRALRVACRAPASRSRPRRRSITSAATRGQANRLTSAAAARAISRAALGLVPQVAQRLGERLRVGRAAPARRRRRRARRRGSRRCPRRPRACRPRTPRSAPSRSSRRRATARTGRRPARARGACFSSSTLPSDPDAARRRASSARAPRGSARSPSARSGCARAAPRTRAAAAAGPCARRPGRRTRSAARSPIGRRARQRGALGIHVHAVGDHP